MVGIDSVGGAGSITVSDSDDTSARGRVTEARKMVNYIENNLDVLEDAVDGSRPKAVNGPEPPTPALGLNEDLLRLTQRLEAIVGRLQALTKRI